jgi:hypothetical protein
VKIKLAKSAKRRESGLTIEAEIPIIFSFVLEYFSDAYITQKPVIKGNNEKKKEFVINAIFTFYKL